MATTMLFDLPAEQITATIDQIAESALWEAGVTAPPIDAFHVASKLGAVVVADVPGGPRARRVALQDGGSAAEELILLAPEDRPERRHWAVAHEVGESLAHSVFMQLGVTSRGDLAGTPELGAREWVANRLACALLLPRNWLLDVMIEVDADLFGIKEVFSTASHELIARRWLEVIGGPVLVTLFDQGEITWRRTNFSAARPTLTTEERHAWRRTHEQGRTTSCEPICYADSGALSRVRCWPIHEPGWCREILLAEVSNDW